MEAKEAILIISMVLALAWSPVAIFFWRAWRSRGAPLSLAITTLSLFPVYSNVMSFFFLDNDPLWMVISLIIVNAFVLILFGVCFRLQATAFPDSRGDTLFPEHEKAKKGAANK